MLSLTPAPLSQVVAELDRTTKNLHRAQDAVARLTPPAEIVLDLRRRQAAWDAEHGGEHGLARMAQRLGGGVPRPTLTL